MLSQISRENQRGRAAAREPGFPKLLQSPAHSTAWAPKMSSFDRGAVRYALTSELTSWDDALIKKNVVSREQCLIAKGFTTEQVVDILAKERAEQAEAAAAELEALGYVRIGLDHFARPDDPMAAAAAQGRLRRNFQGYTTDPAETLIGLGATSISRTPSGYAQNLAETGAWAREVAAGRLPVAKGRALSPDDRLRGWAIERLMCDFELDAGEAAARFGVSPDWAEDAFARLADLRADGFAVVEGGRLRLTEAGRPLVRIAAAAFDAYLGEGAARHSLAV